VSLVRSYARPPNTPSGCANAPLGRYVRVRKNEKSAVYTLTLRAEGNGPPAAIRLRKALKVMLRSFGLRCILIQQIGTAQASEASESTATPSASSTPQRGYKRKRHNKGAES
jgi:hypothetical protein